MKLELIGGPKGGKHGAGDHLPFGQGQDFTGVEITGDMHGKIVCQASVKRLPGLVWGLHLYSAAEKLSGGFSSSFFKIFFFLHLECLHNMIVNPAGYVYIETINYAVLSLYQSTAENVQKYAFDCPEPYVFLT
jgi:hypothetical protein